LARRGHPGGLSAAGKKELWERWRAGESISGIARALQKAPGSIHGMIEATGGFSPPERRKRRCALTPAEREEISRGLASGESLRAIAARLSRSASTVCREVNRNGGRRNYRAQNAEERASKRARRHKRCLLAIDGRLRELIAEKLKEDCSPQQISGWLKREYPSDEAMRVSHETIYRTLFVQARGALKRELLAHLRSRRMMRRSRHASTRGQPRGQIKEAVSIRERPPEAEDRAIPGHWEGDLLAAARATPM
jgi:transposase, IS30 family